MNNKSLLDIPISPLGYGSYGLSGAYGNKLDETKMVKILRYAYELGIKFYDTSSSYDNTEEILGKAIKPYRKDITLATKVGLLDGNRVNLSKEFVKASCELSLKNLKTDYIDIYQVHYHDPNTPVAETIEALESLKKEGKIRYYGVGHLPLDKTMKYLEVGDISFVLAEMNPANTYRYKELDPLIKNFNFDIIAFSITGRGILSGEINKNTKFHSKDIRSIDPLFRKSRLNTSLRIKDKLQEIGNRYGKTSSQIAILWTIENSGVVAGLMGPTKIEHLYENSQALNFTLDREIIEEINQFIKKEEEELKKVMYKELDNILNLPLISNCEKTYKDLIYVMEFSIENRIISYNDGLDIYRKILKINIKENNSLDSLNEIKEEIKTLINFEKK